MTFPFDWQDKRLEAADLNLFPAEFGEIVRSFLPCEEVHFAGPLSGGESNPQLKAGLEMVRSEQKPVVDAADREYLYLPLWSGEELFGVAVLVNRDPVYQEYGADRLQETSRMISREMKRVKQYAVDPLTGLPLGRALQRGVEVRLKRGAVPEREGGSSVLVLLEIHQRARDAEQELNLTARAAAFLDSLIGHLSAPFHLGSGIFGLLWDDVGEEQALEMTDMLLRWCKREGFVKSHAGFTAIDAERRRKGQAKEVFDQAWQALKTARKRGPFALCSYRAVSERTSHPLYPPPIKVFSALKSLWQEDERFGLILVHLDQEQTPAGDWQWQGSELLGVEPFVPVNEEEVFVYLAGAAREQAEGWCSGFRERAAGTGKSFSLGAALYPCQDFKKSEMAANCRKALLHTGFFGPGSLTFFDGVSLNISGDIYYNEGDLARAAKEYRKGLQLDPGNINLLNSLGVTYAQMNLYKKAIPLFGEVLALDETNFMAHFNLGFAYLSCHEEEKALVSLEKALQLEDDNFALLLQLGKLYCAAGRFSEAVTVLRKGEKVGPVGVRDISHGAVYRYLGEAYRGLGDHGLAMTCLQRATRHNPRDGAALSLLGELYCRERQGEEIALSLCRQAVELDSSQWQSWERLAWVESELGDLEAALKSVRQGLGLGRNNVSLLLLLGRIHEKQGKSSQAIKTYRRILRLDRQCPAARARLTALEESESVLN